MQQINPNLKTLGQLISKQNFCDWFFNYNYEATGQTLNVFTQNAQWSPSSIPGYLLNCPVLSQFWSNINQYTFNQNAWTVQLPNLLGMIYDLFKNAIPYDQTTFSTQIQPSWASGGNTSQPVTINALDVMTQISSYLGFYINRIVEWCVLMWKYNTQLTTLYSGYTNSYAYNTLSGHASQGQQLNINSFDPVTQSSTVTPTNLQVQEPSYTMGIGSNSMSNSTPAVLNSNAVTIDNGANWNNTGTANVSNSSQAATNQAINLENMASIGTGDNMTLLRPLIKKISSLFWSLGNDYYPDNINWGFNIW